MYFDHRVSRNGCNLQSVSSNIPDRRRATFEEIVFFHEKTWGPTHQKSVGRMSLGKSYRLKGGDMLRGSFRKSGFKGLFTVKSHIIWNTSTFFGGFFEDFWKRQKEWLAPKHFLWGTQPETRLRIRGRGVPKLGKPQVPGGWRGEGDGWEVQGGASSLKLTNGCTWKWLKLDFSIFFFLGLICLISGAMWPVRFRGTG